MTMEEVDFIYWFADVFNGHTFHQYLKRVVAKYAPWKVFMIIDNSPAHRLDDVGKAWLYANPSAIELHRLPAYSPEFNPMEPIWKTTRKMTTHNRFYRTPRERDDSLRLTFSKFRRRPELIAAHLARFQ